ncbi:hypothetical protein FOA52_012288 [Chlamydomonas sp. UWO 241]|nr:hypothetical protein FOA52_012288 [Chlamydomonas sp. UWO 241]
MRPVRLAACNLNQWALDFTGNLARIRASIEQARLQGASYRVGPELEIPGYGCEDHFFELDTVEHSWECLAELLRGDDTVGIVCDVGMPVLHRGVAYNCRVFLLDRKVLLIRPKTAMANDGNYREARWFSAWKRRRTLEDFSLPAAVSAVAGQATCPFGDGILQFDDARLAAETCEELFTPRAPHIDLALSGVEIFSNGSGSHHQLRKLDQRLDLIQGATAKAGGVYLYANQRGCDGGRLYYDGCACVAINGQLVAQGSQFGLADVEVVVACVDLDAVVSFRNAMASLREQASETVAPPAVRVPFALSSGAGGMQLCIPITPRLHAPEEEIAFGPACWLWDYLRRSGASGFLLPLSGGADSSSTAAIVGAMCQLVVQYAAQGSEEVAAEARRIGQYGPNEKIDDAQALANRIFVTAYMGSVNSSRETRDRSKQLASEVGSYHLALNIDSVCEALVSMFQGLTGRRPQFRVDSGTPAENLALQNIQARIRMVTAFLLAQLTPWVRGRTGFLLVLGSANVDECLRGYLTKYDCSSADINPIGGISKQDLRRFLRWGARALGYPELARVEGAAPTAELEPIRDGTPPQTDEADMGMSYDELSVFGRLRMISRCGPVSMLRQCMQLWGGLNSPSVIAAKVKHFFKFYAINRHKATVLTPSYHAENYSPDDNRFDHRPFLYNVFWPWQFKRIDELVARAEAPPPESAQHSGVSSSGTGSFGAGAGQPVSAGAGAGAGRPVGAGEGAAAAKGMGSAVQARCTCTKPASRSRASTRGTRPSRLCTCMEICGRGDGRHCAHPPRNLVPEPLQPRLRAAAPAAHDGQRCRDGVGVASVHCAERVAVREVAIRLWKNELKILKSGSIAITRPLAPESSDAVRAKLPMFAPTSTTMSPGLRRGLSHPPRPACPALAAHKSAGSVRTPLPPDEKMAALSLEAQRYGKLNAREMMMSKLHHNRKWFDSGEYFLTREGKMLQDLLPGGPAAESLPPRLSKDAPYVVAPPRPVFVGGAPKASASSQVSDY